MGLLLHSALVFSRLTFSFPHRVTLCKTPGCFLQSLSNPGANYGRNFKQNKEELTSKLFLLYNTTVFDSKVKKNFFLSLVTLLGNHATCHVFEFFNTSNIFSL